MMLPEPERSPEGPAPRPALQPVMQNRMLWAGGGLLAAIIVGSGAFFYSGHSGKNPLPPPAADTTDTVANAANTQSIAAQLPMLPSSQGAEALARTSFTPEQQARILAAVKEGEMKLVQMPVLDASGKAGQAIDVTTSGMTQRVILTGKFQPLVLPLSVAGEVIIAPVTPPASPALTIGAMTALGPEILPSLTALDQRIMLSVIVQ